MNKKNIEEYLKYAQIASAAYAFEDFKTNPKYKYNEFIKGKISWNI